MKLIFMDEILIKYMYFIKKKNFLNKIFLKIFFKLKNQITF